MILQSYFGANVLHPRTIIPVMRYDIPIVIRNIFNLSAPGTMICRPSTSEEEHGQIADFPVRGFATVDNVALVNVEGLAISLLFRLFHVLQKLCFCVYL